MDGVSVVIVCGGRSGRMGEDKKFLTLHGKTFLEHAVGTARAVSDKVVLVVGTMEQKAATAAVTDLPVYVDEVEGVGPLMGVLTGLENIDTEYGAVLPVDTPLARPEVMRYLVSLREGHDGVVPEDRGYLEPLHAVYRKDAMVEACRKALDTGVRSVHWAARSLKNVKLVPLEELKGLDPELVTFKGINTPEDLARIEEG